LGYLIMATDIVQSLFGVTPEMYQQRQSAAADERALALAQLTPMQRAEFNIGRGAYQLAGALGGTDPELARISLRQSVARDLDPTNPESIQAGVQRLAPVDPQGAMMLASEYRRAMESAALVKQRGREAAAKNPIQELLASGKYTPASIGTYANTGDVAQLVPVAGEDKATSEERNARAFAALKGKPGTPEYEAAYKAKLTELVGKRPPTPTIQQLQEYRATLPADSPLRAEVDAAIKAVGRAGTTITNVLPGAKELADIPEFRRKVQGTIDPQLKTVTATDQALQAIEDSLATGNFASYRAAQVQFARAIAGAGDLSQKELKAAGADPSLLGGTADYLSTLFSSTPTADTQNKIKQTLNAIRTVAANKATQEIDRQRKIALSSPGYPAEAVNAALDFPEFAPRPARGARALTPADQALLDKYVTPRK
jgi:hypothetical protein